MPSVIDFYNQHSEQYRAFEIQIESEPQRFPLLYALREKEKELLKSVPKNSVVLYAAGGTGINPAILAKAGAAVTTVELAPEMVKLICQTLKQEGIGYQLIEETTRPDFQIPISQPSEVTIVIDDLRKLQIPRDQFERVYSYCTLPLLGGDWKHVLKNMVESVPWGVVSVYDPQHKQILAQYYEAAGFRTKINGNTIYKEGGFEYSFLDQNKVAPIIESRRNLKIVSAGIGKLLLWD